MEIAALNATEPPDTKNKKELQRFKNTDTSFNSQMNNRAVMKYCKPDSESEEAMKYAVEKFNLSARSYFKTLKAARTIADLDGCVKIKPLHVREALQYGS